MSATLESITLQAMALPVEERAELLERLADGFVLPTSLHSAWSAELARRVADLDSGRTHAVPTQDVMAQVRALIERAAPTSAT